MTDDMIARLEALERQVEMLASEISELNNRNDFLKTEMADLRDASSTLSRWVEKLAEEAGLDHH